MLNLRQRQRLSQKKSRPAGAIRGGVPRVPRRAVVVVDTRSTKGKLDHMRLSQQHRTFAKEAAGYVGIGFGHVIATQYGTPVVLMPSTSMRSLNARGIPCRGPRK